MKIVNQTPDQMVLKDSNITGFFLGVLITFGAAFAAYRFYILFGKSNQLWISLGAVVVGLIVLLSSAAITLTINKIQNQIFFQQTRIIGTTSKTFNIQDALRVEMRKAFTQTTTTGTMRRQTLSYQSIIVFKDGNEVPLESMKNSGSGSINGILMGGTGKELSMASQVASFIGVPFQEVGPGAPSGFSGMIN